MKKVNLILLFMIPVLAFAQKSQLNTFFDKYSGQEGYTSVHITKYMFQLFEKVSDEKEDKEFKDVTSKLDAIKILAIDSKADEVSQKAFKNELIQKLPKSIYKDLMIIKEGKKEITFMIREEGNKISELVMFVDEPNESALIFLEGDIDLKKISKLSKTMKIDGFEHLDKVDKK
ncbi:MAG: DUF4252 domain-containing protein [Bacteroidales bacterium]|nr:DUF4252 domain-containing protein [Bacteroidales bacterium]